MTQSLRLRLTKISHKLLIAIIYLIVFSLLDILSQRFQIFPGIVAWYPPDGVSFAFLLTFGPLFIPVVALASIISSLIIYQFNAPLAPILGWAVVLSVAFGINALILKRRVTSNRQMSDIGNTLVWIVSSTVITIMLAIISVSNLVELGVVPAISALDAAFQWWIGEITGLVVFTPFLLIYVMPWLKRFGEGKRVFLRYRKIHFKLDPEVIVQTIVMVFVLFLVFGFQPLQKFHLHSLIAVPLIWVAIRHGFSRVSFAIVLTNFGIMFAVWLFKYPQAQIAENQFLLFGIFLSVLFIGAIITKQKESDVELRKREVLFRALVENAKDAILMIDTNRIIEYHSPAATRILGYEGENHIGSNAARFTHPDDAPWLGVLFEEMIKTPSKLVVAQYRVRHKSGEWHWLESTFTNEINNPSIKAIVVNFHDITEEKIAAETLSKSEKRFRALVEQSQEEISLLDANGNLLYESPTSRRPLGYLPDEKIGKTLFDLFHPDERDDVIQLFISVASNPGMVEKALFRMRHQNGSWRWMEGYISNMLEEPAVEAIVINYSDVTERIEKEEEINVLAKFPSESPNPILRIDLDGLLLYANEASEVIKQMWGCSVGEYIPKYMIDIARVAFGRHENIPVEIKCEDKVYSIIATPILKSGYVNLYGRDITKRVRAEESLIVSNEELSMLFQLSHSLAEADSLGHIFDIVNRHAVESLHITFARIALLENERFVMKAGFPIREIKPDFRLGESIPVSQLPFSQQVLKNNEIKVIESDDPEIGEAEKNIIFHSDAKSICLVPLRTSDSSAESETLVGILMLGETGRENEQPFSPEKMRLAQTIGDSAAIAIRRMLLREQTEIRVQQLIALSEIDLAIISNTDMSDRLEVVCRQVSEQLKVDAVTVWTYDPSIERLVLATGCGFKSSSFSNAQPVKLDEGVIGQVFLKRQMIHHANIIDENKNPRFAKSLEEEPFMGYYAIPLVANNEARGVLEIFHRTELEGDADWMYFLQILANQAAIAIDNSLLFNNLEQSNIELIQAYDATIQGWSRALDLRDNETEGHTQRVTELTMKLARMFGLPEEDLIHIRRGALLHDIGKMGVPDRILLKPGPLTDEEWVIMRQHTSFAEQLLSPIAFLKPALDIPLCHHEKWDGTGYPLGLAGDQIPFSARIFSVVDVWDALTSDRPYRTAWPEEKVLEYIRSLSGTQFDPQVVTVCLEPGFLSGTQKYHAAMEQMTWSEKFSVGDKEMDLQHQRIIGMINRLISVTGTTHIHSETASKLIDEMSQYAKIHFAAEERLMASEGFTGLEEHKLQHQQFHIKVNEYSSSLNRGEKMKAEDLLEFLKSWLQHHILVEDMTYKTFLDEKKIE